MHKILIGYYQLEKEMEFVDNCYECAAWNQTIRVPAGRYPLYALGYQYNERERHYTKQVTDSSVFIEMQGEVVADDFRGRYFGGIINGSQLNQRVGVTDIYRVNFYAHSLAEKLLYGTDPLPGVEGKLELLPEFEAVALPFTYQGQELKTYGIFRKG
jgi:hypothetical protein